MPKRPSRSASASARVQRAQRVERAQTPSERAQTESAAPLVPRRHELPLLQSAAAHCLACALGPPATQTVFGEGAASARLILIGEQPGDEEDKQGRPFVGPAGQLLDRALAAAGIERGDVYLTNAVKHFSFIYRGKRRLHQKPHVRYVRACQPWLQAELDAVTAPVIVALGATAAQALLGTSFALTKNRGRALQHESGKQVVATFHPSAALRAPDEDARHATFAAIVDDLKLALQTASAAGSGSATPTRARRRTGS